MAEAGSKVYFVLGEASGDALGADLMDGFAAIGFNCVHCGLAGPSMQTRGASSLFDIADISVMGLSAIVGRLPTIMRRIRQTADDIIATEPDVVVLIDSPEFCQRVAKRVKAARSSLPIVKYICPSVWAWRPGRARTLATYIDHILAILPFEPALLRELGGPPTTYVGHPLGWRLAGKHHSRTLDPKRRKTVLFLPGSRRSEARLLLPDMARTLEILKGRNADVQVIIPAVEHLADEIRKAVADWPVQADVVSGEAAKGDAFSKADAALAASGTVILELALHGIPVISIYRLDWLAHQVRHLITGWSAALPNLITDETIVPERVGDMIRPGWLARALEALLVDGLARRVQMEGFERMAARMKTEEPPGHKAARIVASLV